MHVRRRDWRSVIVEESVRALLWFHPGVWLLLAELRQAREEVIDRATVRMLGSRRSYLETLVTLADRGDRLRLSTALPFFRSRVGGVHVPAPHCPGVDSSTRDFSGHARRGSTHIPHAVALAR